jgi:hypothetical protein
VGSTTPTVNRVAGTPNQPSWAADMPRTAGDLLLLQGYAYSTSDFTDPTGWTRCGTEGNNGEARSALWYLKATGGDAAPSLVCTGASRMYASLSEWSGWDGNAPTCAGNANGTTGNPITVTGSASPGAANGMSITSHGMHGTTAAITYTPPTGWTNNGIYLLSDGSHAGSDYKLNPPTTGADSEAITYTGFTPDHTVAFYCFFNASGAAPAANSGFFALLHRR